MSTFPLRIVTPERLFFEGEVEHLVVKTTEGDVGILKNHIDYVASLYVGKLRMKQDGEWRVAALAGGFLTVKQSRATIVAYACEWQDEIDVDRAREALERMESEKQRKQSEKRDARLEYQIKKALNRIDIGS